MAFAIKFLGSAAAELKALRVFDQRRIAEEIEKQLRDQPAVATRNRKCLFGFTPSFEHDPPIWELRVGDFRVFYDVDEEGQVKVRAVREKAHGQTTEDIT
jgi:mRNA-degrading endonuclease RelE of RelBE toxin-antitoxin system